MYPRLDKDFYQRHDVLQVAKDLLGKVLVTNIDGKQTAGIMTEVEAYRAPDDRACHAFNNRLTERTKVMFMEGGHAYIYISYGVHHLFNVVTANEGVAHAVLVRGIEPIEGIDLMLERRSFDALKPHLTTGPGSLGVALGIHKQYNGTNMLAADAPIWIEDRGIIVDTENIIATTRIGVEPAGECALWDWRFYIKGSKYVLKPLKNN